MTKYYVYHLVDPETMHVRYIGKSVSPKARLKTHINESCELQNTEKKEWIYSLVKKGLKPVLIVVADYSIESQARTRESIECHKHKNTITNIHDPEKGAKDIKRNLPH